MEFEAADAAGSLRHGLLSFSQCLPRRPFPKPDQYSEVSEGPLESAVQVKLHFRAQVGYLVS